MFFQYFFQYLMQPLVRTHRLHLPLFQSHWIQVDFIRAQHLESYAHESFFRKTEIPQKLVRI